MSRVGSFYIFKRMVLCIGLCSLVSATSYAQSIQPTSTSSSAHTFRGIYVLGPSSQALNSPYVNGIVMWHDWYQIEPQQGNFSWSQLDSEVNSTTRAGKHFTLTIAAGIGTPRWVYSLGAASVGLSQGTVPLPWDPTYLQYFKDMVAALGTRYAGNPSLDGVQMTGVNYLDGETGLVIGTRVSDCARWMGVGYTNSLVVSAFSQILTEFTDDFPGVQLAGALVPRGFCSNANSFDMNLNNSLLALGGWVPQNNGWNNQWVMSNMVGDQEVGALGSLLPAALDLALAQPSTRFLQLYSKDVSNSKFTANIAAAQRVLLSR